VIDWETALGADGALEAAIEAREEGLVRFIGVTPTRWHASWLRPSQSWHRSEQTEAKDTRHLP
jgi:hypothetical protein